MSGESHKRVTALWASPSPAAFESALAERNVDLVQATGQEETLARATSEAIDAVVVDSTSETAIENVHRLTEEADLPVLFLVGSADGAATESVRIEAALDAGAVTTVNTTAPAAIANRIHRAVQHAADRRDAHLFEQLLSGLHVESGDTIFIKDEHSRFVRVSESKAKEVGESRAEIRGKSDFDYMSEAEARKRYEDEREIMETGEPIVGDEERLVTHEGDVRWYQVTKLPRRDEDGTIVGTYGLSRDITELKQLEETLSELEALIDRVPVWLLAVDADGEVTWANEPAEARLVDDGELVGRSFETLTQGGPLSSDFRGRYERAVDALLEAARDCDGDGAADRHVSHEVPIELPDGERRFCDVHLRLLPLAEGECNGTVLAFHDVTTQVEQEQELERQYDRLERLVHTISHDLRNPLQVATGHIDIAAEQYDSELIDRTADAVDRMDVLVEELLTLAREGREPEDPKSVSLEAIARDAWQPFADEQADPEMGGASLEIVGDTTLQGDPNRLVRLFENTFRNAVEHAGPNVTVTVGPTDSGGFFVADDGAGVPEHERDDVLEFGYTTSDEGTGFGLAIVEEIARAHGYSTTITESAAGGVRLAFEPTT